MDNCHNLVGYYVTEALQLGYREYEHTHVNKNIFRQQQEYRTHRLVGWILILQALMCYFPKYLWTACEKKLTKFILKGLNNELLGQDMDESLYYSLKKYLNVSKFKFNIVMSEEVY